MTAFRWWLSKQINALAWWICPQPHRHHLEASWAAVKADWIDEMCAQVRKEAKPLAAHDHCNDDFKESEASASGELR